MQNIRELSNKDMDSFNIAKTILELYAEHEASWNGEAYTLGHLWRSLIEPYLNGQAKHSAFALALKTFGWQYTNDVRDICEQIVRHNLK